MERRNLIRLLVGLAIGIPVAIEAVTFFGLLEAKLFGGGEDREPTTPTVDRVGVGEVLLPATDPREVVTNAEVRGQDPPWVFVLSAEVDNRLTVPYEFKLETVKLGNGRTVSGDATTGRIPAGQAGQVTGAWEIPEGSTPARVAVRGIAYREAGTEETTADVALAQVPVRGG